jgi:hypothetical protein
MGVRRGAPGSAVRRAAKQSRKLRGLFLFGLLRFARNDGNSRSKRLLF